MLVEPLVQGQLELKSKALGASERSLRLTGLYSHPRVIPGPKLSIIRSGVIVSTVVTVVPVIRNTCNE
jgi:hypothetical protein